MQLHDGEIYKALRTRELILRGFREGLPFQDVQIQPASVDLRLDDRFSPLYVGLADAAGSPFRKEE